MSTHIEWTDATWSPLRARLKVVPAGQIEIGWHCERVSPGCQNCYAERLNEKRFGTGLPYNRKSRDQVEVFLDLEMLEKPLHWRRPRKIFVCSMSDLFGEWVTPQMHRQIFATIKRTPQHIYQILTKRPEGMASHLPEDWGEGYPNVWLGVSVEDQRRADERIPELLATPAAVRFISAEPLLGPLELPFGRRCENCAELFEHCDCARPAHGIVWVIVGGESGPGARPMDIAWARALRDQCQAAGVAFFMKQFGSNPVFHRDELPVGASAYEAIGGMQDARFEVRLKDRKGGDMAEWPNDLRVREFPHA